MNARFLLAKTVQRLVFSRAEKRKNTIVMISNVNQSLNNNDNRFKGIQTFRD